MKLHEEQSISAFQEFLFKRNKSTEKRHFGKEQKKRVIFAFASIHTGVNGEETVGGQLEQPNGTSKTSNSLIC